MLTPARSSRFKQWDPRKFIVATNFYNLEDKVDLEEVGNDRITKIRSGDGL